MQLVKLFCIKEYAVTKIILKIAQGKGGEKKSKKPNLIGRHTNS